MMAYRFLTHIAALTLTLSLALAGVFTSARAASAADSPPAGLHSLKFYLDPALIPDMAFARSVLPKYVSDMNAILAKNTRLQLAFDPETGIIPTSTKPETDSAALPLPTGSFEIWAHATMTTSSISYGGYAGVDVSGAGVLAGLHWTQLHDPDHLATGEMLDYSVQISNMLHELAHVFGAGIGEYYSLASIPDTTHTAPALNIDLNDPADAYWSDKPDFMTDPLLRLTPAATRGAYLQHVRYSSLTAAVLNGDFRNGIPSFTHYTIQVVDENGQPLPGAHAMVWSIMARSPFTSQLLYDGPVDERGQVVLAWGGTGDPHNSDDLLRLVKVYGNDGTPLTKPRYISIFDADMDQLVSQGNPYVVTMNAANFGPTDISLSKNSVDENLPSGSLIGVLSSTATTVNTFSYSFCDGAADASFQISGSNLRSAEVFHYGINESYTKCIQSDAGSNGESFQKQFTIRITKPAKASARSESVGMNDGWARESAETSSAGGTMNVSATTFNLGDDAARRQYRAILAFDTSLPGNAVITSVTLKIKKQGHVGAANPFASLGNIVVDIRKGTFGASGLQVTDFQAAASKNAALTFTNSLVGGWYSTTLSAANFGYINKSGITQFRLRFTKDDNNNLVADYLRFYSGNAAASYRPVLVVEYSTP